MSTDDEEKMDVVLRLLNDGSITVSEAYLLLGDSDINIVIDNEEDREDEISDIRNKEEETPEEKEVKKSILTTINEIIQNMDAISEIDQNKVFDSKTGFCKN